MPKCARMAALALSDKMMLKLQYNTEYVLEQSLVCGKSKAEKQDTGSCGVHYHGSMSCTRYVFFIWSEGRPYYVAVFCSIAPKTFSKFQ